MEAIGLRGDIDDRAGCARSAAGGGAEASGTGAEGGRQVEHRCRGSDAWNSDGDDRQKAHI